MRTAARVLPLVPLAVLAACRASSRDLPGMDPLVKDWTDIVAAPLGILGFVLAVLAFLRESKKNREEREEGRKEDERARLQRERDLRWQKAKLAKEVLDHDLWGDARAGAALDMLGWGERDYETPNGTFTVRREHVAAALRVENEVFTDLEVFVRDSFDALFGTMEMVQHYINIDLIELDDVRYPFDFCAGVMEEDRATFEPYLGKYEYDRAVNLWRLLVGRPMRWPGNDADRLAALRFLLRRNQRARRGPVSAEELAAEFESADREPVRRHLETMERIGEVRRTPDGYETAAEPL